MRKIRWDAVGTFISGLCLAHCIALPLLVLVAPAVSTFFFLQPGLTHAVLFFLVCVAAVMSFIPGYRTHKHRLPLMLSILGISLLAFASFFVHDWLGHLWEPPLAVCGSLLLIAAHWVNHIKCKSCTEHHCRGQEPPH